MPRLIAFRRLKMRRSRVQLNPGKIRAQLEEATEEPFAKIKKAQLGSLEEAKTYVLD